MVEYKLRTTLWYIEDYLQRAEYEGRTMTADEIKHLIDTIHEGLLLPA
jgi:hypothetical protein